MTRRLSDGLRKKYWEIVSPVQIEKLRGSHTPGKWLLANFVLEEPDLGASTKARLVLDPSGTLNNTLVSPPNIEQSISTFLRRLQALGAVHILCQPPGGGGVWTPIFG